MKHFLEKVTINGNHRKAVNTPCLPTTVATRISPSTFFYSRSCGGCIFPAAASGVGSSTSSSVTTVEVPFCSITSISISVTSIVLRLRWFLATNFCMTFLVAIRTCDPGVIARLRAISSNVSVKRLAENLVKEKNSSLPHFVAVTALNLLLSGTILLSVTLFSAL
jgi:hypothetical protein